MSRQPLISIALCTYNGAPFLSEQLDSLLAQDWENLEIVAVDDGSTDGTRDILHDYSSRDLRITVHFNDENLGFLSNFEKAFSLTKGEFIAPCDQDDWWHPGKLRGLHAAMGDRDLAYCDSLLVAPDGASLGCQVSDVFQMYGGSDPAVFVFTNCVSGHALLARRTLIERAMPFPRGHFHDWWLAFVAASTGGLIFVPKPWVRYRQHAAAQTNLLGRDSSKKRVTPRWLELDNCHGWIEILAGFPSPHQPFFRALQGAWAEWRESWVCPRLVFLLLKRRKSLYHINRRTAQTRIRRAFRFLVGMKLKRLMNPRRYGSGEAVPPGARDAVR